MNITGLGHTAVRASNFEESIHFYKDILELEEVFRIYNENGDTRIVYFYVGGRQFIELFPNGTVPTEYPGNKIGLVHICLEVEDVEEAYRDLEKKGVTFDTGLQIGKAKCRQFWIHDPDGTPIELMQLPPESMQAQAIVRMKNR